MSANKNNFLSFYSLAVGADCLGGTNQHTKVAADAEAWIHHGLALRHMQRLMPAVTTGEDAASATKAFLAMEAGEKLCLTIQLIQLGYIFQTESLQIGQAGQGFFAEVPGDAVNQILDDARAVLHDGGGNLDMIGA